jgi:hypothetical protein
MTLQHLTPVAPNMRILIWESQIRILPRLLTEMEAADDSAFLRDLLEMLDGADAAQPLAGDPVALEDFLSPLADESAPAPTTTERAVRTTSAARMKVTAPIERRGAPVFSIDGDLLALFAEGARHCASGGGIAD